MSARSVAAELAALAFVAGAAGCDGCSDGTRQPAPTPSATPSDDAGRALSLHRAARDAAPAPRLGCRVTEGGDATRWITAPRPVVVRVLESGRETKVAGDVLPCADIGNVDVTLLARGSAESLAGGEGAGSEAWIASPCAAVRANGAGHAIVAREEECSIHSSGGGLQIWIPADVQVQAEAGTAGLGRGTWRRVEPHTDLTVRFDPAKPVNAVEACESAAAAMDAVSAAMERGALGQAAAQAATVRGSIRAACAIARARVQRVAPDAGDDPLRQRVDAAIARGLGSLRR